MQHGQTREPEPPGDIPVRPSSPRASGSVDRRRGPQPGPGARLLDVARAAGVSQQTVSNVLNGRTGFSDETRRRVLAAATELDYSPNRAAQRLRSRRSQQIGLHLPAEQLTVRNTFSISFLRAATEAAEVAGQQLVVSTTPLDERSVKALVRSGVDGFLMCNVGEEDARPAVFAELGVPFALMGRLDPTLPQSCVDIDNVAAMAAVVDHLVERGHRRIGYVGYAAGRYWDAERLAGTLGRLRAHGLEILDDWLVTGATDTISAQVSARLRDGNLPDAVICSSDSLAILVHGAIGGAGLQPGLDVALTGFDGLTLPVDLDPPLTSVRLPVEAAATAVLELLLRQIEGEAAPTEGLVIPIDLAIGGTT